MRCIMVILAACYSMAPGAFFKVPFQEFIFHTKLTRAMLVGNRRHLETALYEHYQEHGSSGATTLYNDLLVSAKNFKSFIKILGIMGSAKITQDVIVAFRATDEDVAYFSMVLIDCVGIMALPALNEFLNASLEGLKLTYEKINNEAQDVFEALTHEVESEKLK